MQITTGNGEPTRKQGLVTRRYGSLASLTAGLVLVLEVIVTSASASHFSINTVAGGGHPLGDGGAATEAILAPADSVQDSQGNTYIAKPFGNSVSKVTPEGIITTIAGTGAAGFSGDGGEATLAQLNQPYGIEVDPSGNLYIADSMNNRVRKVSPSGVITTVAGGSNDLSDGVPAINSALSTPYRVTFHEGELFISDTGNHKIRKVDSKGLISTFAGSVSGFEGDGGPATAARMNLPWKVDFDASGNAYIADAANHRIRKVDPSGIMTTFAGTGVAGWSGDGLTRTQATFNHPVDIAFDNAGAMLVADLDNWRVRKISGDLVTTFAGGGPANKESTIADGIPATSAHLGRVWGISFSEGAAFSSSDVRVRRVDPEGLIWTFAGGGDPCFGGDGGSATAARLCGPRGAAEDSQGNMFIADTSNRRVRRVSGGSISTVAGDGGLGQSGDGGPAVQASFIFPVAALPDEAGGLYVLDSGSARVRFVSPDGVITTVAGNGQEGFSGDGGPAAEAALKDPSAIAIGPGGKLYIADTGNHRIRMVSNGLITTVAGDGSAGSHGDGGPAVAAGLSSPQGVAVDRGNTIYIADSTNHRIRKVSPSGNIDTLYGGDVSERIYPTSITVDPEGIRILFVDEFTEQDTRCPSGKRDTCSPDWAVRQIDGFGQLSYLAGGNGRGFSGDGERSLDARFDGLRSVFLSESGYVIVSDSGNNRVRQFQMDPISGSERDIARSAASLRSFKEEAIDPQVNQALVTAKDGLRKAEEVLADGVEEGLTAISETSASALFGADQLVNRTKRVSTAHGDIQSNGKSDQARISGDGRHVAFVSSATNLVANDLNGTEDVFVKDRLTGRTVLVSISTSGAQGNAASIQPSISEDGRLIAFTSAASNLVADDLNARDDVFLRDRDTDEDGKFDEPDAVSTLIVSGAPGNLPADGQGGHPSLSPNGRYLAFASLASNLVPGDLNAMADVFLRDLDLGITSRVSTGIAEGNGHSVWPSVADGGTVAFESWASNLVSDDSNNVADIFVGGAAGTSARVSLGSDGSQSVLDSSGASISGNGRYVAFHTASPDMEPIDANAVHDVFVRDLISGDLRLVSVGVGDLSANGGSASPSLSWDGRYVAFGSSASNLIPNDFNLAIDVFVRDMEVGTTRRASVSSQLSESNGLSMFPSISRDGWAVAFQSDASNLVDEDSNSVTDVFVRYLPT